MQERELLPQATAVPLGHKLIAVIIAAGCGWGVHAWMQHRAMQSAWTARLSFDSAAARKIDPGLGDAREPAVALAESILSDQAIAGLSKQAYLASSAMSSRVGEFRSRLELTQPSASLLQVRFHDADSARAEATADAVAQALAAWNPSGTTPAAAVPATPKAPPAAVQPARAPAARPQASRAPAAEAQNRQAQDGQEQAGHSLSDALGALEAQLADTNRQLDRMSGAGGRTRFGHRPYGGGSYSQSKQQQLLRAQVREAQKKLAALRVQYANDSPGAGVEGRLSEIQQALISVWPASNGSGHGFNGAGTSASQLRRERAELEHVVRVVDKERLAIHRAEEAQGGAARAAQKRSRPASEPAANSAAQGVAESDITPTKTATSGTGPATNSAAQTPPAAAQLASAGSSQPVENATGSSQNPLHVTALASPPARTSPWPAVGAGVLCGLLYLGGAKLRYRTGAGDASAYDAGDDGSAAVSPVYPQRFITPSGPVKAAEPPVSRAEALPVATSPRQRVPFTFEPAPMERAPARSTPPAAQEEPPPEPAAQPPEAREELRAEDNAAGDVTALSSGHEEKLSPDDPVKPVGSPQDEMAAVHESELTSAHARELPSMSEEKLTSKQEEELASTPERDQQPELTLVHEEEPAQGHEEPVSEYDEEQAEHPTEQAEHTTEQAAHAHPTEQAGHDTDSTVDARSATAEPEEGVVAIGDPVTDRIRRALSETSIGSLFENSAARNADREAHRTGKDQEHAKDPDRLAG